MNNPIYNVQTTGAQRVVLEEMRKLIAKVAGVTLVGNRLTIRFMLGEKLVDVHSVIIEVTDTLDEPEEETPQ